MSLLLLLNKKLTPSKKVITDYRVYDTCYKIKFFDLYLSLDFFNLIFSLLKRLYLYIY